MDSNKPTKPDRVNINFTAQAEKWRRGVLRRIQQRASIPKWRRFVEAIQTKYASPSTKFDHVKNRVQAETPEQKDIAAGRLIDRREGPENLYPDRQQVPIPGPQSAIDSNQGNKPGREPRPERPTMSKQPQPKTAPQWEPEIERSSHFQPDFRLQEFLAGILNIRIPFVKVYANRASDALVKQLDADAVSYGDKILFRAGKFDPRSPQGIALLGHELTHAAVARLQAPNGPDSQKEPDTMSPLNRNQFFDSEEQEALDNEKRVLQYFAQTGEGREYREPASLFPITGSVDYPSPASGPISVPPQVPSITPIYHHEPDRPRRTRGAGNRPSRTPSGSPRTALRTRDLNPAVAADTNVNSSNQLSASQLRMIKDEVYQDLLNRIRTEFERGG